MHPLLSAEYTVETSAGAMIAGLSAAGVPPWFMLARSAGEISDVDDDGWGESEAGRSAERARPARAGVCSALVTYLVAHDMLGVLGATVAAARSGERMLALGAPRNGQPATWRRAALSSTASRRQTGSVTCRRCRRPCA